MTTKRDLKTRLQAGPVVCAEGFVFEMERRGYLTAGEFVPEVALENPRALEQLHLDFQHAGSEVVEAFTYYAHREKLRLIGRENDLEELNRAALRIARRVADNAPGGEPDLVAGNICNSNIWEPGNAKIKAEVRAMFREVCQWAKEEGADFIIGETYVYAEEAFLALEEIQRVGLDAVLTTGLKASNVFADDWQVDDCALELAQRGALVVGMNCHRGWSTMKPWIEKIIDKVGDKAYIAALPVPYRTTTEHPTFFNLPDNNGCWCDSPNGRPFPTALDPMLNNRYEIRQFAQEALDLGVRYLGVCCGAAPVHIREVAEVCGRQPAASRYQENMAKHCLFGTDAAIPEHMRAQGAEA